MSRILRAIFEPFARLFRLFFDPRFDQLGTRLEGQINLLEEQINTRLEEQINTRLEEQINLLSASHRETEAGARAMAEAVAESLAHLNRTMRESNAVLGALTQPGGQLDHLAQRTDAMAEQTSALTERIEKVVPEIAPVPHDLESLRERDASLLNHAESHRGFAAERGLWLNPPVTLRYSAGDVDLGDINERIAEIPFVFETMAELEEGSRVLDVGCAESTVAFSLASLGYEVTGIDLHPYPLAHPNLAMIVGPLEDWGGPAEPFDGVICLSSIEHFGLGVYGEEEREGLDLLAMKRIASWVKPGAILALTAPFGRSRVNDHQRVYDLSDVERLLAGWEIEEQHFAVRLDDGTGWKVVEGGAEVSDLGEGEHSAVILVAARRAVE